MKETKFKQTEIGMIPDDWEVKELGELFSIKHGFGFKSEFFSDENNQKVVVTPGNFKLDGGFQYQNKPIYYTGVYPEEFELASDDLVITMTDLSKNSDTLGNPMLIPKDGFVYLHNQRIGLVKILWSNCNKSFLFRLLCSKDYHHKVVSTAAGSTVKHTSPKRIYDVAVPLPPTIAEQQKIAKALSDVDNVISTLEKLIAKKKNLKQGTMQQLLTGKKRLPGFAKSSDFKQTEIGEIPEDWEVVNISRMCTIKARIGWQGLKSDEYLDTGDYLLITGTDFDNGFINWKNCSYVTEWRFKQDKNIQIKKGDVLITKDGTIGKVAFLNEVPMAGTLNSGVFVVRPKDYDLIDSVFLSLIFKSFWFDNFLEQITSGSTIVHLYQKDFVKFNYILPSKPEQTAIANVLSSMDKEIEALNTKLEKYRNLKTGMMQQLLTGKIRLV